MECIINDLKISYKVFGEGRPLLILHGWGSKKENWKEVAKRLNAKVIIPDLPGFGESQKPSFAWTVSDYCQFVKEFAEKLKLEKFFLLGHSFGGSITASYASKYPNNLERIFLVSAACIREASFKTKLIKFISKFIKIKNLSLRKLFYRKSDYLAAEGVMKEIYLKLIKTDLSYLLEKIKIPTIIIWGKKDKITPLKHGWLIKEKIENSEIKVIKKAGHDLNLKFPKELSEAINSCF